MVKVVAGVTVVMMRMRTPCTLRRTLKRAPTSDGEGEEDNSQQDNPHDESEGEANTPQHPGSSSSHHSTDKHLHPHSSSWGSECNSKGAEKGERAATQEDVVEEESSSESKSSSNGEVDVEDAGEELLQTSPPTLQELEEPPASVLTGAEPTTRETKYGVSEEVKLAGDMGTEDMEVTLSEVASTAGNLRPTSSQDAVIIHAPKVEVRSLK